MTIYSLGTDRPIVPDSGRYWIADNASVIGKVRLEENASVWFGAVLRGDNEWITIGANSNVQDGSVLHTDVDYPLTLGKGVTIGHMAMVHGCDVGDNSLIGIGATVLDGAKIGKNCLIGAHALVPMNKDIPDNSMVLGTPGKVVRQLTDDEIRGLQESAKTYVRLSSQFRADLRLVAGGTDLPKALQP